MRLNLGDRHGPYLGTFRPVVGRSNSSAAVTNRGTPTLCLCGSIRIWSGYTVCALDRLFVGPGSDGRDCTENGEFMNRIITDVCAGFPGWRWRRRTRLRMTGWLAR